LKCNLKRKEIEMAQNRMGHRPGGGIASRQHVQTPVRTGSGSKSTRPAGVSQIGYAVGDKVTSQRGSTGYKGEKLHSPERNFQPVKFGNEVALNVGKGGPGAGRTLYGQSGQQGCHGQPASGNPQPQQGDILSQYGPESKRR
jgi:hypothetical protein